MSKPTLIIVDDLREIREELHALLQADFEIVAEASSAREAVDAVRRHQPDLVLMDVVMPQTSGIDATAALCQGTSPKPLIVMLSGVREEKTVSQALQAGATDYLFKPWDERTLPRTLLGIVSHTKNRTP